jgi:hypothetical protein
MEKYIKSGNYLIVPFTWRTVVKLSIWQNRCVKYGQNSSHFKASQTYNDEWMIIIESKWRKSKLQQVARYAELRQLIRKIIHPNGNINMWFKIFHIYVKISYYAVYSSTSYTIIMNFHFTTKYQKEPLTDFSPDWRVWGPVLCRTSSISSTCNCSAGITGAQTVNLAEGRQMRVTTKHVSNKKQWSFCKKKKVHRGVNNVLSHMHHMFCLVWFSYNLSSCSYLEAKRPQFSHPPCSSYITCIQQN